MAMNLYAAQRFTTTGGAVKKTTPMLVSDDGTVTGVGDLDWSAHRATFEALAEGRSHVVSISMRHDTGNVPLIAEGWHITKLPAYQQHRVLFDEHAKEYVLISNGRCVLNHTDPKAYTESHKGGECQYAHSEAIALRPFVSNGKVALAWTYRTVNPCDLRPVSNEAEIKASFEAVLSRRRSARFIGRV